MNIDKLRDNIAGLIELADVREIPLSQVQAIFREENLSARNFSGLKTKLSGVYNSDTLTRLQNNLKRFIDNHIIFDDKLITLVENINLNDFKQKLSVTFNESHYAYTNYKTTQISPNKTLYQFTTIREINVRETLSVDNLREDISEDYQELIGIKTTKLHCYDFVLLDFDRNIAIIGIDLAQILGANEASIASINFANFLKKEIKINIANSQKTDLFPKIKDFYNLPIDETNGVVEIYFITDEGTAHHETARGNTKDLRTATYHSSGVQGLRNIKSINEMLTADISAYRITSKFYQGNSELQIALKSSYIAINTANGSHLYEAYIYGVRNLEQFNFIIDKLVT